VAKGFVLDVTHRGDILRVPSVFVNPHSHPRKMRLLGIRCASVESGTLKEAYFAALARKFSMTWTKNREVILELPIKNSKGTAIRKTGYIKDFKTKDYLHELLLEKGLAVVDLQDRELGLRGERILMLEKKAKEDKVGIWSNKLPPEYKMRDLIKDQTGLLSLLISSIGKNDKEDKEDKVKPDSTSKTKTPKKVDNESIKVMMVRIHRLSSDAQEKHLLWDLASKVDKAKLVKEVKLALREVKIHIMDALDDHDNLTKKDRLILEKRRQLMNDLLKSLKNK